MLTIVGPGSGRSQEPGALSGSLTQVASSTAFLGTLAGSYTRVQPTEIGMQAAQVNFTHYAITLTPKKFIYYCVYWKGREAERGRKTELSLTDLLPQSWLGQVEPSSQTLTGPAM